MERYDSDPMPFEVPADLTRADLVFYGVDHSGPSYEARVFFDNTGATLETARSEEERYAGYFAVFGHGACYGEEGHCDPRDEHHDEFDIRPPHPLEPLTRTVIVTEALRLAADRCRAEGRPLEVTVTVVAAEHPGPTAQRTDALRFQRVRLLTYAG